MKASPSRNKIYSNKMDRLIITIGGGTRGLGLAILEEFNRYGCDTKAFHCREDKSHTGESYYFDANIDESLEKAKVELLKTIEENTKYKEIIIVFLTGGGNPGTNGEAKETNSELIKKRIFQHNYDIPTEITDLIEEKIREINYIDTIKLVFISSAVAVHKKADPHYCAAKSALESYFQSKFKQKGTRANMYLYRLGMVDIKHKYYHKLSINSPSQFREMLKNMVPSNHFSQPEEIAEVIRETVLDSNACNGLFCDISGGNSWQ
jgi:NAD(P)-dependent dehydrogenase (short-subunit alcohol dehydrogenase family)